jgi:hypothetical protein
VFVRQPVVREVFQVLIVLPAGPAGGQVVRGGRGKNERVLEAVQHEFGPVSITEQELAQFQVAQ